MSWRLKVTHHTGLKYTGTVSASFNEVRMTPMDDKGQFLIAHELKTSPAARIQPYVDYWGTHVEAFDLHEQHDQLEISSVNVVETSSAPDLRDDVTWDLLHDHSVTDQWCEFLQPSRYVDDALEDPSRLEVIERLRDLETPAESVRMASDAVSDHMKYIPGSTNVFTTAAEAWADQTGVCQDFTHVLLSLLRPLGIPARYVSGYLYTGSGDIGETVSGESHAWVEVWLGSWIGVDPTNGRDVGEGHVIVARGRDYADVSPLKGIYAGGMSEALGVEVQLTRLPR